MKRLLFSFSILFSGATFAQSNLLDQEFWKNNPDIPSIKSELDKGASLTEKNKMAFDPIALAILNGASPEAINFLLSQNNIDVNTPTHDGRSYIFWAAVKGNIPVMEALLNKGANPNLEDTHGATPLSFAAGRQTDPKIFETLIAHGADVKRKYKDGANLLLVTIGNDKDLTLADYWVSKGLSLQSTDDNGNTAFNYAAKSGNLDVLKKLVQKGVKYNDNAILMASEGSFRTSTKLDVYQYLVSLGIKPAAKGTNGENVLHNIAKKADQEDIIRYFLDKGVDANQADNEGNTPFMNACAANKDVHVIELLLPKVKKINLANKKGATALSLAVQGNTADIVSLLITKGADLKTKDAAGNTLAYYWFQSIGSKRGGFGGGGRGEGGFGADRKEEKDEPAAKLQLLKDKGIDFSAPQEEGNTLYHLAVAKQDLALLKKVSALGININTKNKQGMTALHKAALVSKDDTMLQYLIAQGAQKDIKTDMGETSYELASDNEYLKKNNVSIDFLK